MKTFDEAVEIVVPVVPSRFMKENTEEFQILKTKVESLVTAFQRDAENNESVRTLIVSFVISVANEEIDPINATLSAFLIGLAIGREMERTEELV